MIKEPVKSVSLKLPKSCFPKCPLCKKDCIYFMFKDEWYSVGEEIRHERVCFDCSTKNDIRDILVSRDEPAYIAEHGFQDYNI